MTTNKNKYVILEYSWSDSPPIATVGQGSPCGKSSGVPRFRRKIAGPPPAAHLVQRPRARLAAAQVAHSTAQRRAQVPTWVALTVGHQADKPKTAEKSEKMNFCPGNHHCGIVRSNWVVPLNLRITRKVTWHKKNSQLSMSCGIPFVIWDLCHREHLAQTLIISCWLPAKLGEQ